MHKVVVYGSQQFLCFSNDSVLYCTSKPCRKRLLRQARSPRAKSHTVPGIAALPQLLCAYLQQFHLFPPIPVLQKPVFLCSAQDGFWVCTASHTSNVKELCQALSKKIAIAVVYSTPFSFLLCAWQSDVMGLQLSASSCVPPFLIRWFGVLMTTALLFAVHWDCAAVHCCPAAMTAISPAIACSIPPV